MFAVEESQADSGLAVEVPAFGAAATVVLAAGESLVNPWHNAAPVWVSMHRRGLDLSGPDAAPEPASMWAVVMLMPGHAIAAKARLFVMVAGITAAPSQAFKIGGDECQTFST